jgi:hypothetical protein
LKEAFYLLPRVFKGQESELGMLGMPVIVLICFVCVCVCVCVHW